MISYLEAAILGLVEGITEFLPISSTGHLIVVGKALGVDEESAKFFEVFIQGAAILAIVILYPRHFSRMLADFVRGRVQVEEGQLSWLKVAVACMPAFVLGALLHKAIKIYLFNPLTVALALIVGGVIMILVERNKGEAEKVSDISQISMKQALLVGLFQCFSLWPGMSRAASTIIGGLLVGLNRKVATEFSFVVAVPVMFAAVGYDFLKSYSLLSAELIPSLVVGAVISFVSAVVAVRWLVRLLTWCDFRPFGWYRIGVGILVLLSFYVF